MEVILDNVEGQVSQTEQATETEVTVETLQEQLKVIVEQNEQLRNTNDRLLAESKENKIKARTYRDEIETQEKKKLEENENWKELLDREKNEKHDLLNQVQHIKKQTLAKSLSLEIAKYAGDAYDMNDIISALPEDKIETDEDRLEFTGVSEAVATLRESKPYLFKTKEIPGTVGSRPENKPQSKTIDQMTTEEKLKALKGVL